MMRERTGRYAERLAWAAVVICLLAASLAAHDFWIEPGLFRVALNRPLAFELRVGDHFKGTVFPRQSNHIRSFEVVSPSGVKSPVLGLDGRSPAGYFRFETPGLYIVSYHSQDNFVSLDLPKFRSYLAEEGLEQRILPQLPEKDTGLPVREAFSRCAKALILVAGGESPDNISGSDRRVGLPLELVADARPQELGGGAHLPVRLFFGESPLQDTLVVALQKNSATRLEVRTDDQGRVELALAPGAWLIKAVHMVPAEAGIDAQFRSFWASLTLEIPPAR